ncbi:MAG TPA: transcription-repair coupling factor [Thermoanaerobaculia bacterium]|jgi:transcription-repair coupling factor (superfamily II helicase)|nr:transcription-repair coupling factor [Thermoanaerobaculia bacterium]
MSGVWAELARTLRSSVPYRRLRDELGAVARLPVARLPLPAAAWVGELLAADLERPLLVVVPHEADALAWLEAVRLVAGEERALYFPAPPLTPYQEGSASLPVRTQEVLALDRLLHGEPVRALIATPRALFQRLPPAAELARRTLALAPGEDWPRELLVEHLLETGYQRVDLVSQAGEAAVRGGVLDVWPPGEPQPLRLDLFGDTLESIRAFDPLSQRSGESLAGARLLPLTLFDAGAHARARLATALAQRVPASPGSGARLPMEAQERLHGLAQGVPFAGWEVLLPLAAPATTWLPELQPRALALAVDPPTLDEEIALLARRLDEDFEVRRAHGELTAPPGELLIPAAEVAAYVAGAAIHIGAGAGGGPAGAASAPVTPIDFGGTLTDVLHGQLPRLPREVEAARARGERFLLVADQEHHANLAELLAGREVQGVELVDGELTRGFRLPAAGVVVFGEPQLWPRRPTATRPQRRGPRFGPFVSGLRDLKIGDYVVHVDHGIGQFLGLRTVEGDGAGATPLPASLRDAAPSSAGAVEVMELAYSAGKTLLLPLSRIDQVQKYGGIEGVAPRLDQLGGASWNKTKDKVRKSVKQLAINLLQLYAERQMARAPAMSRGSDLEQQFTAAFAYDETEDQLEAIAAIFGDLEREQPMDRLLCGDVGFGKTEVAMRAAFRAVDNGHQVAVLAPTTILADQHLETFKKRFEGLPITIEMISRFRTPAEIRDIRDRAKAGKVDILIGTHRLLSKDVSLPRLALLIIDEEQRFGVAHKERLRDLKKTLHVLAMSATPVPRTLQLSLAGVRDLSVIETPPRDRMAVETAILPFTGELIREAIEYERERGGQIYYVYNKVADIDNMAGYLRELVPGLRVTVGHGQMDERELSRRMHAFTAGDYDLLLASTIIENGIHIPRVNTMLVHRAERFGLAQLYQLRGRVGRSNTLGYCYLLVPADRVLPADARKRLDALRDFSELGAGFRIAARDLEIRGAGSLLGAEQSGHIASVGIETYMKLLEDTMRELRGEVVEEAPSATLDLPVPMAIPTDYIDNANLRMEVYRKIAAADVEPEAMLAELRERFGPPPQAVYQLLDVARLKRLAERLRVQSLSWQKGELIIRLRRDAKIDPDRLVELVSTRPDATFSPNGVLTLRPRGGELLDVARGTLERLAS